VATLAVTGRADLTDAQWAVLEPLLPAGRKPGRPPKWTKRQLINGIRWRVRAGAPWRDVPPQYGPWQTVYGLFRRWQRAGTWRQVLTGLQARAGAVGLITWVVSVDSTVARAHQHAAGARKKGDLQVEPPGGIDAEPADHGLGRSRGGLTTKVHLACERAGPKPLSVVITAGQRGDSPQFQAVLDRIRVPRPGRGRPRTRPRRVLADKAYGSAMKPPSTSPPSTYGSATTYRARPSFRDDHVRARGPSRGCGVPGGDAPDGRVASGTWMNTAPLLSVVVDVRSSISRLPGAIPRLGVNAGQLLLVLVGEPRAR
jgi:transposase